MEVFLVLYYFSGWKFTVGLLSFLGTTTILWHQVVGVPNGTFSMTPITSSLFSRTLTSGEGLVREIEQRKVWVHHACNIFSGGPCIFERGFTTIEGWRCVVVPDPLLQLWDCFFGCAEWSSPSTFERKSWLSGCRYKYFQVSLLAPTVSPCWCGWGYFCSCCSAVASESEVSKLVRQISVGPIIPDI